MESSRTTGGTQYKADEFNAEAEELTSLWASVRAELRKELGQAAFRSWVKPLTLIRIEGGQAKMSVPTRFIRDWILSRYGDRLLMFLKRQDPRIRTMEISVGIPPKSLPTSFDEDSEEEFERHAANGDLDEVMSARMMDDTSAPDITKVTSKLDKRFTFGSFIIGKPNELAYTAAKRVAESDTVPFNPLFLYGGVGLGKTHLMHAIAWHLKTKNPSKKVLYVSAEKFMYQFIRALRYKDTVAFKEQFRSVDLLLIDDVQFISGKESTQEEFYHTFNALIDQNRQVIISSDRAPSDLEGLDERLRSRLGWGLVADLHPCTYELRLGILQSKAQQLGIELPEEVLEFLSRKISSNIRELEGALNRIVAHTSLVNQPVTLESTQELLQDLLRASDRKVSIEEIQKRVAEHFNIRLSDMYSARRSRTVARPRQIAMSLSKQLTQRSLPEIGRKFGGRDHTTVIHAVRKVDELCTKDPAFAEDVALLRRMLES